MLRLPDPRNDASADQLVIQINGLVAKQSERWVVDHPHDAPIAGVDTFQPVVWGNEMVRGKAAHPHSFADARALTGDEPVCWWVPGDNPVATTTATAVWVPLAPDLVLQYEWDVVGGLLAGAELRILRF